MTVTTTERELVGETRPVPARRPGRRFPIGKSVITVILLIVSALTVFPLVWLVLTSLRNQNTIFNGPIFPAHITFAAYGQVWDSTQFGLHFWNSLWMTTVTVAGVLILSSLTGYAFAKLNFRFKNAIYVALLATLMMPATALIIPLYLELKDFGLLNTQIGLVIVYISSSTPFCMFLMRAFIETLPDELIQGARIDGAGEFTIFLKVVLPLARPGIATVIIFQFLSTWNEFLYANTLMSSNQTGQPLQPVLYSLIGQYATNWPTLCAGLTMTIIPVILVYVWMQRQFVAGLTLGAVKN